MLKADMTKYCTAAALAVRTFITGSSNLNNYGAGIRQIGTDLGLRLDDLDNLKKTRGSWLGTMVDFLGTARVTAVYQLIANGDKKPASWGAAPNAAQQSALNIQKQTDVYNTFKRFATLWNGGANPHPKWQQEAGAMGASTKQALEAAYTAARDLTVGWYDGSPFDHAYVIVSNRGYATDKNTVASYCICDAWLGRAYPDLLSDLHYGGTNLQDVKQSSPALPELKVGTYAYASTGDDLTRIQGVTQILHSAFLDELAKL
jgi:hypothetical protein